MYVYMWWAVNFWPRVVRQEKWKIDVASRNKKPSDLVTISDEALALLLFENDFQSWKDKAESGHEGDAESQTSFVTSDDSSTRYTRKHRSTKDGCSEECIARFRQSMAKVREDHASTKISGFCVTIQTNFG
jgi:transcription elongation factor GreA-like protein